jgi:hypothetical protein
LRKKPSCEQIHIHIIVKNTKFDCLFWKIESALSGFRNFFSIWGADILKTLNRKGQKYRHNKSFRHKRFVSSSPGVAAWTFKGTLSTGTCVSMIILSVLFLSGVLNIVLSKNQFTISLTPLTVTRTEYKLQMISEQMPYLFNLRIYTQDILHFSTDFTK